MAKKKMSNDRLKEKFLIAQENRQANHGEEVLISRRKRLEGVIDLLKREVVDLQNTIKTKNKAIDEAAREIISFQYLVQNVIIELTKTVYGNRAKLLTMSSPNLIGNGSEHTAEKYKDEVTTLVTSARALILLSKETLPFLVCPDDPECPCPRGTLARLIKTIRYGDDECSNPEMPKGVCS